MTNKDDYQIMTCPHCKLNYSCPGLGNGDYACPSCGKLVLSKSVTIHTETGMAELGGSTWGPFGLALYGKALDEWLKDTDDK